MTSAPPRLVLAVPSKGRLQENAANFFARAGLHIVQGRGSRDYRGTVSGIDDIEIAFLPVSEIVAQIAEGQVHLGVAGEDLLREQVHDADGRAALIAPLNFGHAHVVVAVPQAWIDVRNMADLEDVAAIFHARRGRRMRVATKYVHLTRDFFAAKGVTDYRIVESLGATEGAPASGTAELIVDITTTGATLAANGLKILDDGTILKSEANLIASLRAAWPAPVLNTARTVLSRIAAEEKARTEREIRAHLPDGGANLLAEAETRFGAEAFPSDAGILQVLHCPENQAASLADWLVENGALRVAVAPLSYVFAARNPLYDAFVARLPDSAKLSTAA